MTFHTDRNSSGVQNMFLRLVYLCFPKITRRRTLLLWHICRGVRESLWRTIDIDYANHRTLTNDLRIVRGYLGVAENSGIPRAIWGLYSLAWGKPIVKETPHDNGGVGDFTGMHAGDPYLFVASGSGNPEARKE